MKVIFPAFHGSPIVQYILSSFWTTEENRTWWRQENVSVLLVIMFSRHFYDKRMGTEVDGEVLGEEFKGYLFKITGGNDKQGFAMKQGV